MAALFILVRVFVAVGAFGAGPTFCWLGILTPTRPQRTRTDGAPRHRHSHPSKGAYGWGPGIVTPTRPQGRVRMGHPGCRRRCWREADSLRE
jgi:hypothetical protein